MATIGVCTSAQKSNIAAFLHMLNSFCSAVIFTELPYNNLDSFMLEPGRVDGIILCHSINNRRFAITDVLDALYDKFLPHAKFILGKENVAVVVHDFSWPLRSDHSQSSHQTSSPADHAKIKKAHMDSFRIRQPTTFQCSSLAMICGKLDTEVQMDKEDTQQLERFLASVQPFRPSKENSLFASVMEEILQAVKKGILICQVLYAWCIESKHLMSYVSTLVSIYITMKEVVFRVCTSVKNDIILKVREQAPRANDGCIKMVMWMISVPFLLGWYSILVSGHWLLSNACTLVSHYMQKVPYFHTITKSVFKMYTTVKELDIVLKALERPPNANDSSVGKLCRVICLVPLNALVAILPHALSNFLVEMCIKGLTLMHWY